MKITFIEPRSPGLHVFSKARLPRLGLPLMATMLRGQGHDVLVFVEDICRVDWERVLSSDLVGISTITSTATRAYAMAGKIKKAKPDLPVVMGGPHVSFMVDEALEHADYIVVGEGEKAALELVARIEAGEAPTDVPGLAYRDNDGVHRNPLAPPPQLDCLPTPDLRLVAGFDSMPIIPIATSRGCPYGCRFCSVIKMFGRKCRYRSVESVVDELARYAPANVFFYDDNFASNPQRTRQLLEEMIRRKIDVKWSAQVRADIASDPELLSLMHRAGATILHIGFESINQASLDEFGKRLDLGQTVKAIKEIHRKGMRIHGMFAIGADNDDPETPKRTVDFAFKHGIDTIQLLMLTPLPGTEYFEQMLHEKRLISMDWQYYDGHHVVFRPAKMSPYVMQYQVMKQMARFYSFRRCMKLAAHFRFVDFYFRFYGWRIIRKWFADQRNLAYLAFLKKSYST